MKARVTRFSLEKWIPCFCLSIRLVFHVFDLQESLSVCPLVWERDGDRRERRRRRLPEARQRGKEGRAVAAVHQRGKRKGGGRHDSLARGLGVNMQNSSKKPSLVKREREKE